MDRSNELKYRLQVCQIPVMPAFDAVSDQCRRRFDPPPLVRLYITDQHGIEKEAPLYDASYVLHCSLWSDDGTKDRNLMLEGNRKTGVLIGSLVSSPKLQRDAKGKMGCFFSFPDLSCRVDGRYRLKFTFMGPTVDAQFAILAEVMSNILQSQKWDLSLANA